MSHYSNPPDEFSEEYTEHCAELFHLKQLNAELLAMLTRTIPYLMTLTVIGEHEAVRSAAQCVIDDTKALLKKAKGEA